MARRRAHTPSDAAPADVRKLTGDELWSARWFGLRCWWMSNTPDRAVFEGVAARPLSLDEKLTDRQRCARLLATELGKTCPTEAVFAFGERIKADRR